MTENRPALQQPQDTAESKGNITTAQIGYGTKQWGAALGYRYGQCGAGHRGDRRSAFLQMLNNGWQTTSTAALNRLLRRWKP